MKFRARPSKFCDHLPHVCWLNCELGADMRIQPPNCVVITDIYVLTYFGTGYRTYISHLRVHGVVLGPAKVGRLAPGKVSKYATTTRKVW